MGKNGLRFLILNPMGKKRRRCGLDWIFNPMGMVKRRRCGSIFNPMGRQKRIRGDGDDHLLFLPEDVLIKIMLGLPVKSLLRLKSVCKSWRELIDSSFFINLHATAAFNSSSSSKFGGSFILQTSNESYDSYEDNIKLYMVSSESGDHGDQYDNDREDDEKKKVFIKVDDLGFLRFYKDFLMNDTLCIVGSCNGIICLHDPDVLDSSRGCTRQHYSNLRDVSLYNPATRQFRILPKSIPIKEKLYGHPDDIIGFGFDIKTKDYKVLRICTPYTPRDDVDAVDAARRGECMCRVQVYSLSTDSWRFLEGINSLPVVQLQYLHPNSRIYLNGSYFFVGRRRYNDGTGDDDSFVLLSFDFTKEIFTTMKLPDNYNFRQENQLVLSSLGGKIALFYCYYKHCDIWVLNEQHGSSGLGGVLNKEESCWTKLNSNLWFGMKEEEEENKRMKGGKPECISISNNGEFALISTWENNKTLKLFNLVTKEATTFTISNRSGRRVDVYKEILVSIMGGGNVLLRWQLPTHGTTYKLNLDAPFINCFRTFGIGLCLTSYDTGGCIGVRSLQRGVRDEEEGEALAMLEAIKWVKELGLSPIIIETDYENCVSFFMEEEEDDDDDDDWSLEAYSLLKEAKLLNSSEISISFQYCSRSYNYVADIAAKLGREGLSWSCKDWTAKFPGEMVRSLSKKHFASKTR